jgi:thioredoxin-like negative regulator of GroEL
MSSHKKRWGQVLLLAGVAAGMIWGGWSLWRIRRDWRAMTAVRTQIAAGRTATAAHNLMAILERKSDSDEALYLLGTCELARGRPDAALEWWARVPPSSRFAARSIQGRVQIQMEHGWLAKAEQIINDALEDPVTQNLGLPILLGPLYTPQGRTDEALRLIEAQWDQLDGAGLGATEKAIVLLRLHIAFQRTTPSVDAIRSDLDRAAQLAPGDDRIWLAKANLAIRARLYNDAAPWLAACLRQRPDDVAVWRARLNWAVATNRVAQVQEALKHLPASESTPAQVVRLAAWLAAKRGDVESERRALERLMEADPTDSNASDRLAELAVSSGQRERAAELLNKQSEIKRIQDRYLKLYERNQPMRDASEMAALAEQLGRWFEARAFLTVAVAVDPDRGNRWLDLARLDQRRRPFRAPGRTLADLLADERGHNQVGNVLKVPH